MISRFKRALQEIPPRELQMLFSVKVLKVEQEETRRAYAVRQSNVSYRLERARYRIQLHMQIYDTVSETQLRRKLFENGFPEMTVKAVTGVVRTSSQTAAAEALRVSQGSVRHIFSTVIGVLQEKDPEGQELQLLKLIERNFNQLRAISSQSRWLWKKGVGGGDRP